MQILYFHQHFNTPAGAGGTRSYEFGKALVRNGHNVTIVCGSTKLGNSGLSGPFIKGRRKGIVEGISVIELDLPYSNYLGFINRSWLFLKYSYFGIKIALFDDYDLLFATSTPLTVGIPGVFAKLFRKKRFIFEVRDLWPELPREMGVITNPVVLFIIDRLESVTYRFADKVVALAPGIKQGILRKYPEKEVVVIPNGSDDTAPKLPESFNKDKLVAVFTGAHGIANGLDAVLDVASILKERNSNDVEIQFIGDGKLKPLLMERAIKENLDNCVFIDPMPKPSLFRYLRESADVGLMILDNIPAFYNGTSPNKFFDYLSLGLPVINNYPGWLAKLITENQCGVAVSPRDTVQFADTLVKLKSDIKLRREYGANSKKLSEARFSRQLLSDKFVGFLESC